MGPVRSSLHEWPESKGSNNNTLNPFSALGANTHVHTPNDSNYLTGRFG